MHLTRRRIGLGLMTSTLLATSPALADNPVVDPQATTVSDVIVTASGTGVDVRDAPASVSVITREDIERQPVKNIGQLLSRLPGVSGGLSGTGEMSKIKLRGLPDNYTLILVDGRRLGSSRDLAYRPDLGRQDLSWISPDMIERIEVVRGPMSSLYGSDAMGGVINIITRKISPTWRGSFSANYTMPQDGDRGDVYQFAVNATGPLAENLGARIGVSYSRQNPDEVALGGRYEDTGSSGITDKSVSTALNWALLPGQTLSFEGTYGLQETVNQPALTGSTSARAAWGASELERTALRLSHEGEWGFGSTKVDLYRNHFVWDMAEGASENTETILDAILNATPHLIWDHKLTIGGQYRDEEIINTDTIGTVPVDYEGNPIDTSGKLSGDTMAIYAEDQITLRENLLLTLGARVDSHDKYGEHFTPRAYLVWHPSESWTVRGGIAQGFRAPTLKESSPGAATQSGGNGCNGLRPMGYSSGGCWMTGNPDLKPEESTNYEIGVAYDRDQWKFGVTYFHTDFENKIEYLPLGFFQNRWWTKRENIQEARTRGLEAIAQAPLRDNLTWNTSLTWMIEAKNLVTGAQLITTPEWAGFSSLDWQATDRIGLFLSAQYTGEQLGGGTAITEGYTMFDLTGRFDVSETVTFRAGITNLFEKEINSSEGYNYYQPGRRIFIGVTSRF